MKMTRRHCTLLLTALGLLVLPVGVLGGEPDPSRSYSPYVDQSYPTQVYWGDTHVHTALSADAYAMGVKLTPDDAYRFAKGEAVTADNGQRAQLRRPLDFLMIADHAENLGVLPRFAAGDERGVQTEQGRRWAQGVKDLVMSTADALSADTADEFNRAGRAIMAFKGGWQIDHGCAEDFRHSVWEEVGANAQRHNDPGKFTTFIGYEWSAAALAMIHRNVLFEGGPDQTNRVLPFSAWDSNDPEDLWAYLKDYEDRIGGKVLAIPHNANLSAGGMFALMNFDGKPFTRGYAQMRSRWEPIIEVTQIKGDSEAHPILSPTDEFANYETYGKPAKGTALTAKGGKTGAKPSQKQMKSKQEWLKEGKGKAKQVKGPYKGKTGKKQTKGSYKGKAGKSQPPRPKIVSQLASLSVEERIQAGYARSALKLGLDQKAKLGVNPFKFGMIGSTDTHTGLSTADEDNFWGKMGTNEPSPYRATTGSMFGAAGYAAIWATENTRESLFAAMRRREVYATTGPRMTVRFFGGWDYVPDDAVRPDLAREGYAKGVPMGGDLTNAPKDKSPRFLIRAVKDPDGANLDRIQVVKGWRDKKGELQEKIYDVTLSDGRTADQGGKVKPVGNTVDLENASYTNGIGDPELAVVWHDPDFDKDELSFYYVRVLEIPTPRWTAYDAKFYGLKDLPENISMIIQERAYSSPIWYSP